METLGQDAYAPFIVDGWRGRFAQEMISPVMNRPHGMLLQMRDGIGELQFYSKKLKILPGQLFICGPGHCLGWHLGLHSYAEVILFDLLFQPRISSGEGERIVHVGKSQQKDFLELWGFAVPQVLPEPWQQELHCEMVAMGDMWWRGDCQRMMANARLNVVLAKLYRAFQPNQVLSEMTSDMDRVEAFAKSRLSQGVRVLDMAEYLGLGRVRFQQLYKKSRGIDASRFLHEQRMSLAMELLIQSSLNIEQVALQVGYRSRSAFNKIFFQETGYLPHLWRTLMQKNDKSLPKPENVLLHTRVEKIYRPK